MRIFRISKFLVLPVIGSFAVACSDSAPSTSSAAPSASVAIRSSQALSAKPSAAPSQAPTSKPAAASCPIAPPPADDGKYAYDKSGVPFDAKRRLSATFSKVSDDKKTMFFKVTNDTCAPVERVEGRLFYMDEAGKCFADAQVVSHDANLAPGETKELPFSGYPDKVEKMKSAELENYKGYAKDGKRVWGNENLWLIDGARCEGRKVGGVSEDELKKHAGQPVLGYYVGKGATKLKFSVKNMSDKPIKSVVVTVYFYDKDGKRADDRGGSVDVSLKPGEAKEIEAGPDLKEIPKETASQEITIQKVTYEDGSTFENFAAGSTSRPPGG